VGLVVEAPAAALDAREHETGLDPRRVAPQVVGRPQGLG
jgi:hypothetical protein